MMQPQGLVNAVIYLLLQIVTSWSLRISPEVPTDFSLQLCTHQRRHMHGHMQYFPKPVRFCSSIRTVKRKKDLMKDLQGTTSLQSTVSFAWRQLAAARTCRVTFTGYQHEYRLTPDFGAYEDCQYALSRHVYGLSEELQQNGPHGRVLEFNTTNSECPILSLPSTYADYISCTLSQNEWYALDYHASIRYETYNDGAYGTYYANHSTSYIFQVTDELQRNGSESDWLGRLVDLDTKVHECDTAQTMVRFEKHWPIVSTITLTYRIISGGIKIHQSHLLTQPIDKWLTFNFKLEQQMGRHEICLHMMSPGDLQIKHRICRLVADDTLCPFDKLSIPPPSERLFGSKSSNSLQMPFIFTCSLLTVILFML